MNIYITHRLDQFSLKTAVRFLDSGKEFRNIFEGNMNSSQPQKYLPKIKETVDLMNKDDFLLIVGSPIITGLWMSVFYKRFGILNLLLWDAVRQQYVKRNLS